MIDQLHKAYINITNSDDGWRNAFFQSLIRRDLQWTTPQTTQALQRLCKANPPPIAFASALTASAWHDTNFPNREDFDFEQSTRSEMIQRIKFGDESAIRPLVELDFKTDPDKGKAMDTPTNDFKTLPLDLLTSFHQAHNQAFADVYFQLRNRLAEGEAPASIKEEFENMIEREYGVVRSELTEMSRGLESMKQQLYSSFDSFTTEDIIVHLGRTQTIIQESLEEKKAEFLNRSRECQKLS